MPRPSPAAKAADFLYRWVFFIAYPFVHFHCLMKSSLHLISFVDKPALVSGLEEHNSSEATLNNILVLVGSSICPSLW